MPVSGAEPPARVVPKTPPATTGAGAGPRPGAAGEPAKVARQAPIALDALHMELAGRSAERGAMHRITDLALRCVALGWLGAGLLAWAQLVGYAPSGVAANWHDPQGPWLVLIAAALLSPIVAIGLWLLAPWGIAVWLALSVALAAGLYGAPDLPFGSGPVAANLGAALIVGLLALSARRRDRLRPAGTNAAR